MFSRALYYSFHAETICFALFVLLLIYTPPDHENVVKGASRKLSHLQILERTRRAMNWFCGVCQKM